MIILFLKSTFINLMLIKDPGTYQYKLIKRAQYSITNSLDVSLTQSSIQEIRLVICKKIIVISHKISRPPSASIADAKISKQNVFSAEAIHGGRFYRIATVEVSACKLDQCEVLEQQSLNWL